MSPLPLLRDGTSPPDYGHSLGKWRPVLEFDRESRDPEIFEAEALSIMIFKGFIGMRLFTGSPIDMSELLNEEVHVFIVKEVNNSLAVTLYDLNKLVHVYL